MSIINNLKMAHAAIVLDQTRKSLNPNDPNLGKLGAEVNKMAVEALTGGIGKDAWTEYMRLYASNEKELARLADVNVNVNDSWLKQQRAYIVSNAICDAGTQGQTTEKVDGEINLAEADSQPDETFIAKRKLTIPPVQ